MEFYDKDPQKGGKRISTWKFLEESGLIAHFKEAGFIFNPTHNFQMLKEAREKNYLNQKIAFEEERNLTEVETTETDKIQFRIVWLENEYLVAEKWLAGNRSNKTNRQKESTISAMIELNKYTEYLTSEIESAKAELNYLKALKNIKENENYIELLYDYAPNIEMLNILKRFNASIYDMSKWNLVKGVSIVNVENIIAVDILHKFVFSPLENIFMFHNQKTKCVKYVKSKLKECPVELFEVIKNNLISCLKDEKRFEGKLDKVKYMIVELNNLTQPDVLNAEFINEREFPFFVGKNSMPLEPFIKAFFSVRGMLKTEKEQIGEYVQLNREAILSHLKQDLNKHIEVHELLKLSDNEAGALNFEFQNNFDHVPTIKVIEHFKTHLVDKGYLSMKVLQNYLIAAFDQKSPPHQLFQFTFTPSKEKIYLVFYTYYVNVAGKPHAKQNFYAELLGNYFSGFNLNTIKTNWAKGYQPRRQ